MISKNNDFLIKKQSPESVKIILQGFENQYQNFRTCWNFELLTQQENSITAQITDHSYEPTREKGQSDAPVFYISIEPSDEDVLLRWKFRWKKSKRRLSLLLLLCLLISSTLLFAVPYGDRKVLLSAILAFCAALYAGWIAQNIWHDLSSQSVFKEMLFKSFDSDEDLDNENEI